MATTEYKKTVAELRKLYTRYEKASTTLDALEAERAALYLKARAIDPPVTYRQIAEIFQVTEAAIMQKTVRAKKALENGAGQ